MHASVTHKVYYRRNEGGSKEEVATHPSILARDASWTERPGGLQSMGSPRVGHDGALVHMRKGEAGLKYPPPFKKCHSPELNYFGFGPFKVEF